MPSCRRLDWLCAVGLILVPIAIFGPALVTGKVVSSADNLLDHAPWQSLAPGYRSHDPTLSDVSQFLHPYAVFGAREIRVGRFPLWNPYAFGGVPFFAHPHSAMLFPLTALAYVLPLTTALTLAAALKLAAAGVAMYWFLRGLPVSFVGALIGALAFQLSGPMVGWLLWPFSSTMIFLPLLFGLAQRLRGASGAREIALIAVAVALDLVAGYPQGAFQDVVAATAWTAMLAIGAAAPIALLLRWAGGVTLGAALAAIQILPFLEYLRDSAVFAYRAQWTPTLTIPFRATLTALMPYVFDRGTDYVGDWHLSIVLVFVGVVPLVMLPIAAIAGSRHPEARFFIGLAMLTAAVTYGMPLVSEIAALPVMSLMRNLVLGHLAVFAVCALAAIAVDEIPHVTAARWPAVVTKAWAMLLVWIALGALLSVDEARQAKLWPHYAWFAATLTAAAIVVLLRMRSGAGRGTAIALIAVQAVSALPFALSYNPVIDAPRFYPTPPLLTRLQTATRDGSRVTLTGSTGTVYRLFEMQGFDAMTPRRIEDVVGAIGSGRAMAMGFRDNPLAVHGDEPLSAIKVVRSAAFDLFGVRYVVVGPREGSPRPGLVLDYDGPDARVWRNDAALPRAFIVFNARCVDDQTGLGLIREGRLAFHEEVLLGNCADPPITGRSGTGSAAIERYDTTAVTITATTDVPGLLVLTDTWFPGWRARVDDRDVPIMRADHAFRAVSLPAGQHRVEFAYQPTSLRIGLMVTAVAAALVLVLALWGARRRHA